MNVPFLFQTDTTQLIDRLPEDVRERADEIVETVKADPTLQAILIGIGILTAFLFVWGVVKQVFKAIIIGGALSAAAWIWYFNLS